MTKTNSRYTTSIAVVSRGEPREVDPRPPQTKESDGVAPYRLEDFAPNESLVQALCRERNSDYDDKVEEQLEGGCRTVFSVGVASPQRDTESKPA